MDQQPKYLPQHQSLFFASGTVEQPRVPGTLARGRWHEDTTYSDGKSFWSGYLDELPIEVTDEVRRRGKERFDIFCAPCHGIAADGVSPLTERTGLKTADLLEPRIQTSRPGKLYEVVTKGSGLMPGYREAISVDDRWMIVAYLRALQKSSGGNREENSS
jgi:mono/diheme cytochrome c family protein